MAVVKLRDVLMPAAIAHKASLQAKNLAARYHQDGERDQSLPERVGHVLLKLGPQVQKRNRFLPELLSVDSFSPIAG